MIVNIPFGKANIYKPNWTRMKGALLQLIDASVLLITLGSVYPDYYFQHIVAVMRAKGKKK